MSSKLSSTWSNTTVSDGARRGLDIGVSLLGLILLAPFFLALVCLMKVMTPGPIFFCPRRVGRHGELFRLVKFRTMVRDADKLGPAITAFRDPRITTLGRFLRRTKMDELPQLINVLKGDMSLVGPRPEDPRYVALYTPEQRRALEARPGITSAASLAYRKEDQLLAVPDWESHYRCEILPAKLKIDLEYLSERTLHSDVMLILWTVRAMFWETRTLAHYDTVKEWLSVRGKATPALIKDEQVDLRSSN